MKKYVKETVTKEQTIFKYLECDLCKKQSKCRDWENGAFEVNETEIRYKTGSSYPEGGSGTEIEIDLCPNCFKDKLIPWLEKQGCKVKEREWDW